MAGSPSFMRAAWNLSNPLSEDSLGLRILAPLNAFRNEVAARGSCGRLSGARISVAESGLEFFRCPFRQPENGQGLNEVQKLMAAAP